LTYEKPDSGERSLRQQLVDQWLAFSRLAEVKEKDKEKVYGLFFGEGGHYTAEQLAERANMYDQVEAQINLMKQDLKQLALEFERLSRR
jgi:stress response protein YsnF